MHLLTNVTQNLLHHYPGYVGNVYLIIHVITVSYKTVPRLQSKNFIPDGDILAILSENTAISEEICEMSKCY